MAPRQPTGDPLESAHSFALSERTSQTDDQRIRDVTPLPPPEHLIRFFPIADTPIEKLIGRTRATRAQDHAGRGRSAAGGDRAVLDPRPGGGARLRAQAEGRARSASPTRWRS